MQVAADRVEDDVEATNRARILEVARETFAAEGLDVAMAEIARRAGLGVATLYRRFRTKEDLVAEAFAEQMGEWTPALR